jgi:aspartate-semialdehyde dehydrogenase
MKQLRIAIAGATGVVGRELLGALEERGHPTDKILLLGSDRSAGEEISYLDDSLAVEKPEADSFRGVDLALLATPFEASRKLAAAAQSAGAWVVDLSPAHRLAPAAEARETAPLVLPGVNDGVLDAPFAGRIVSVPGAPAAALLSALEPLRATFGLVRAHATVLLGASSAGQRGIATLETQTAGLLSGREPDEEEEGSTAPPSPFPHRLAFNLVPQVGDLSSDWSSEERGLRAEAARVWGGEAPVSATAIQTPTFYGVCLEVLVELRRAPEHAEALRQALRGSSRIKVLDAPAEKIYPMPMLVTADPTYHVGRVRLLPDAPTWASLFIAVDNAGRGAALNALEVAERLAARAG